MPAACLLVPRTPVAAACRRCLLALPPPCLPPLPALPACLPACWLIAWLPALPIMSAAGALLEHLQQRDVPTLPRHCKHKTRRR